jgi:hypothetical protein
MGGDFERRIAAIEKKLNATLSSAFRILLIEACLPGGPWSACAGSHRWRRQVGETVEQFAERCAQDALAAGEASLTVGGLPTETLEEMGFANFEE